MMERKGGNLPGGAGTRIVSGRQQVVPQGEEVARGEHLPHGMEDFAVLEGKSLDAIGKIACAGTSTSTPSSTDCFSSESSFCFLGGAK